MYYMKEETEADDHVWPEEEEEVLTGVKKKKKAFFRKSVKALYSKGWEL